MIGPSDVLTFRSTKTQSIKDVTVYVDPVQDLHGYDNPWPAGGGKNKLNILTASDTLNDVSIVSNNDTQSITLNGTASANGASTISIGSCTIPAGSYLASVNNPISGISNYSVVRLKKGNTTVVDVPLKYGSDVSFTLESEATLSMVCRVQSGDVFQSKTINVMIRNSTVADNTWAPYSNICPISGHTDVDVIVSPTLNPSDGTTYPIPLGQTVYGGTLDVTTGKLTVDRAIWTASAENLVLINDNAFYSTVIPNIKYSQTQNTTDVISNKFKAGVTGNQDTCFINTNGRIRLNTSTSYSTVADMLADIGEITVVYPLATPIVYDLAPTEVTTLLGTNNVWSDCGQVSAKILIM